MRNQIAFIVGCLLVFAAACTKNSSSENSTASSNANRLMKGAFTVPPFDSAVVTALVPLGNLNPPAHTFPTDHMYFYCFTQLPSLNIKSPGNVTVFRVVRTHYNAGLASAYYDYTIAMGYDSSYLYWGHVSTLSPRLAAAVNNFSTAKCQPSYITGGATFQQCFMNVSIQATPGEVLGIAVTKGGIAGMDFGATVMGTGANPLEYFDANARSLMEPKLGRYDGKVKRTAPPIYGEINQDITATAMGNWVRQGFPRSPEDNNIALVKDNIDPSKQAISTGVALPGLPSGVYYFVPQSSGFTNRNFAEVKQDGNTYCYTLGVKDFPFPGNSLLPSTSVIVKLENNNTLTVEKRNCDCACAPYVFSSNKVTYSR